MSDQKALHADQLEVAPGTEREELQGCVPELASPEEIRIALEKAFHYRGDITITCKDGAIVEGYLFDRRTHGTLDASVVRVLLASGEKVSISYAQIARLVFSGRDTASGKSYEAWVEKYKQARAAGETFGIQPEALD